jgi:succinate-semialdehyde dehydrogenase/glutarate-semialdehyde dehydrogenase
MTRALELSELIHSHNFIDGKWTPAQGNLRFVVTHPRPARTSLRRPTAAPPMPAPPPDATDRAPPARRVRVPKERAAVLHRWHALTVANLDAPGVELARTEKASRGRQR